MDLEVCSYCEGLRCLWIHRNIMNDHLFDICSKEKRLTCESSKPRCLRYCPECRGKGRLSWIDNIFQKSPERNYSLVRMLNKFLLENNISFYTSDEEICELFNIKYPTRGNLPGRICNLDKDKIKLPYLYSGEIYER